MKTIKINSNLVMVIKHIQSVSFYEPPNDSFESLISIRTATEIQTVAFEDEEKARKFYYKIIKLIENSK